MGYTTAGVISFCAFFFGILVKGNNMMKVNGTYMDLTVKQSLQDFLVSRNHDISRIAVELNGEIVPKAIYSQVMLDNGDTLEIVRFVGGG